MQVDFTEKRIRYRQQHLQGKNELIAKAIGWKKDLTFHVFDTTAGFGKEAFLLAALGCEVTLFERHPLMHALLKEGLVQGANHPEIAPIIARMHLVQACAIETLNNQRFHHPPDVIYCDPMFEPRKKSAAVKKEMQLLHTLVGQDLDAKALVDAALNVAQKRVVVKRAYYAPPLRENPSFCFKARSHRFDVYLVQQSNIP